MSLRNAALFEGQKGSPILRAQWAQRAALQPLPAGFLLLEEDRTATRYFRGAAKAAFPTRQPLPFEPLADEAGLGTNVFWKWFE